VGGRYLDNDGLGRRGLGQAPKTQHLLLQPLNGRASRLSVVIVIVIVIIIVVVVVVVRFGSLLLRCFLCLLRNTCLCVRWLVTLILLLRWLVVLLGSIGLCLWFSISGRLHRHSTIGIWRCLLLLLFGGSSLVSHLLCGYFSFDGCLHSFQSDVLNE
jgi:hypothetical protein